VTLPARVVVERLPSEYRLDKVAPEVVEVTLSGRRRDLLLARGALEARIDALLVKLGRRSFEISPDEVSRPAGVQVVEIAPARVRLTVVDESTPPALEVPEALRLPEPVAPPEAAALPSAPPAPDESS
jgi:hypothetical protein